MRLIDADALIPKLKFICEGENQIYRRESWGFAIQCLNAVEDAPTINPQPRWIPCSERLPELDDEVLVTDDYDCIRHCVFCKRGETWRGFVTYEEGMTIDAIAWQPLPSPYREEDDE